MKGVGTLIALTYVLTLEDPRRFCKSRDVGCYLGIATGAQELRAKRAAIARQQGRRLLPKNVVVKHRNRQAKTNQRTIILPIRVMTTSCGQSGPSLPCTEFSLLLFQAQDRWRKDHSGKENLQIEEMAIPSHTNRYVTASCIRGHNLVRLAQKPLALAFPKPLDS